MKRIILDGNKNYYKANLHSHSAKSDGSMTVEEVKEAYKKKGYSVVAFTDHLDYGTVMNALENHNFYASTGPVIKDLYIEDDDAYITFENAVFVAMSTKVRRSQRQEAPNPDGENTLKFKIQQNDVYVRFDVVDKYGKRANTNAIWL